MLPRIYHCLVPKAKQPLITALMALVIAMSNVGVVDTSQAAINNSPVGSGFAITAADLAYILKQIKIAERHSRAFEGDATAAPQPNPHPDADPSYCLSMIGTAVDQVPDAITSYGLRTVTGDCNNLKAVFNTTTLNDAPPPTPTFANSPTFGAADQPFPRLTEPSFRTAEAVPPTFGGGPVTSYAQKLNGNVVYDTQPRLISNLIVDQTSTNPAAIAAAGFPVRAQNGGNPTVPCAKNADGTDIVPLTPDGCVPRYQTLFIENVTTDVGLSPPYNSLFTFFGQFFDHGVDQTVKGFGTVIVPLRDDDPLIAGPDHIPGNADDLPPEKRFIPLTRGQNQPGPDGLFGTDDDVQDANNTDTPWVDQSQTYTSHPSHQVFLREYNLVACTVAGNPTQCPVTTAGKFLGGLPAGQTYTDSPDASTAISTWASTKKQAAEKLGLLLVDTDVTNIPMIMADPYGNFIPGPARGLPQYVTATGLVEGNLASPVPVPANVLHFDTPFLTDIAHNAEPKPGLVPDADSTSSADFANQPVGTYDNEMLNAHFTCGDGRCNENIALSSVHQIFHSEHNRLAKEFDTITLPNSPSLFGNASLLADYQDTYCAIGCAHPSDATHPTTYTYGQRLFQAARFVTEMEYQHLVFEEFGRKIQPLIRPFHLYNPDVNAATKAEFAHAVYRFGHSMLDDDVARVNVDPVTNAKTDNSLPLLKAFLNPPEYFNNGAGGFYTPEEAAGAIMMGSSDQVGNELDEFINETLRNNLLGLPLDLGTFNLTRARSEGIPPLNDVRRQIFAQTNDGQMTPYTSWSDFGQHLKHPESLINFVAAYGTHPSITGVSTLAEKRNAARAIVDPLMTDVQPADAADFMFSQPLTTWASDPNGVTTTGLDSVDLWVGGLAEVTNLFGGLLGSTFNYVFQTQLEDLQDFDRFYYLNRTPGMNLRTQLEGNSFSELVRRNTEKTNTLKADPFATADCKFQLANLSSPAVAAGVDGVLGTADDNTVLGAGSVNDDPTTECNENLLLLKQPNGTFQYRARNSVDPAGINGQLVMNGTDGVDRMFGGNDNDTFWGGLGNDIIEGGGGDDIALGGEGDDIITDLDGADVLKGGPGNDALDGGPGDDILLSNEGIDFDNGGANDNETFAGPGNDFVIAGLGADAVFGDDGDDWIEGGSGQDLLQGDHGAPFFDDPGQTAPGNDIFVGQVGENDYDAEGGDDLMAQNAAVDRNAGAGGFDWAFHQYNTTPADDDMEINKVLVGVPIQLVVNRDRWQETEADSGDKFNDVVHGTTDALPLGGGGFTGCDALDVAGVTRISGLDKLVTTFPSPLAPIVAASAAGFCPLNGGSATGNVWAEGNILLGGGGSDVIEGRGNNDIIDGDHALHVKISINGLAAGAASTDLMENIPTGPGWTTGALAGKTLQAAVFAGLVNPGQLVAVREIVAPDGSPMGASANTSTASDCPAPSVTQDLSLTHNCDTAWFSNPSANYTITSNADGSITVTDNSAVTNDGIDTLWNIEQLSFCTTPDAVVKTRCAVREVPIPVAPVVLASPASVAFGSLTVGSNLVRTITVSNGGLANLNVTGVTLTGADAASFQISTNTCIGTLVHGAAPCTVSVRFLPTTTGLKSASVSIASNGTGSPTLIPLTGTGVVPTVSVTVGGVPASTLDFGNVNTGTTSATRTVVLTNTSTVGLTINNIQVEASPVFASVAAPAPRCAAGTLAPGAACNINVRFSPGATTGLMTGSITITDNAVPSPQIVTLSGTGVVQLPVAQVAPAAVDFGNVVVGSTFDIPVTLTNTGTGATPMSIANIAVAGGGFSRVGAANAVAPNCGTSLAAGVSCNITVRFAPTNALGTGAKTGTLTITDNSNNIPGSQQTVGLSGFAAISATVDATTVAASGVAAAQSIAFNVRGNDVPNVATSVVSIVSSSFTNGGATAVASVTGATSQQITWTLTPTGANATARAASKRGTYTVNYKLTNGTATATATYVLTVN